MEGLGEVTTMLVKIGYKTGGAKCYFGAPHIED